MVALKKRLILTRSELQREYYDLLENPDSQDILLWLTEVEHVVAKLRSQHALNDDQIGYIFRDAIIAIEYQQLGFFIICHTRDDASIDELVRKTRHYIRELACARDDF